MVPIDAYTRLVARDVPIYVRPDPPDWFIPTPDADALLCALRAGRTVEEAAGAGMSLDAARRLLARVPAEASAPYAGRAAHRTLDRLRECWLHLTNRCNMACAHCMFCSGPRAGLSLPVEVATGVVRQAADLGCCVYYLTGGEPFVYEGLKAVCDAILGIADAHAVILTNGKELDAFEPWLRAVPRERLHFQLSIDGLAARHDRIRGSGAFAQLERALALLGALGFSRTCAMSVNAQNVDDMPGVVDFAAAAGVRNVHFLWLFGKGNAGKGAPLVVAPDAILPRAVAAHERACETGTSVDNFEILKSQIFSIPGTRFDLSNAAWDSLCVGPDGQVCPSPALALEPALAAGEVAAGLERVWRESAVLARVRGASVADCERLRADPLRYLVGGGDPDHSFIAAGTFVGDDPYLPLYDRMALHLLAREARTHADTRGPGLVCRMGERLHECDAEGAPVQLTHSNCVLSLPGSDGYALVKAFYTRAAEAVNTDIVNPVAYDEAAVSHIPLAARIRSYGCGSPVLDCGLAEGETLADLGSGTGVECLIAARAVGPEGRAFGIDMSDTMLDLARRNAETVARDLGYANVDFRKGLLERLPLDSDTVDVVISNCVINLSPDKRRTFREIRRVLKPGGRLVISDIVAPEGVPIEIKYDGKLRGECIGGAMAARELFAMLEELGFEGIRLLKRFLYRRVHGYPFHSITYQAHRPSGTVSRDVIYRGPFAAVVTDDGDVLPRGLPTRVGLPASVELDSESVFVLDEDGNVTNAEECACCSCATPPEAAETPTEERHAAGCMVCGEALDYGVSEEVCVCHYCGQSAVSRAVCVRGHFVCDACHGADALDVIRRLCIESREQDAITLFKQIRRLPRQPSLPRHGPEHHSLVPGILLSVYRNRGGRITDEDIAAGIERGRTLGGGACAFTGTCGAAAGVGIAFSIILGADPLKPRKRQIVQKVTCEVLGRIAAFEAARCCQRDCVIALRAASDLARQYLPVDLPADEEMVCTIHSQNAECLGRTCPLWPSDSRE